MMDASTCRFKIGEITCTAFSDGQFVYAPPLFPPPAHLLSLNAPAAELAQTLKDDGVDPAGWQESVSAYSCLLIEAGLRPDDIDMVVITHAHPDHLGGNTDASGAPRSPDSAAWCETGRASPG